MAVSKVAYDGHTLIDLTSDTAVESDVADGKWFHKSNGERVQGTSGKVIVQGSDSSAFLVRPTAGETLAPLDCDRKSVLKKLGNTVCVNQLAKELNSTNYSANSASASFSDGVATITASARYGGINQPLIAVPVGHQVFMSATIKLTTASNQIQFLLQYGGGTAASLYTQATTNEQIVSGILSVTGGNATNLMVRDNRTSDRDAFTVKNIRVIDLTLWFGSNDRIPSDLLSHPENWGRYYAGALAYNAGTLDSADGTVLKSIGRNMWDEEWEVGGISSATGGNAVDATRIRSQNYVPVIPNASYYIYNGTTSNLFSIYYYDSAQNYIGVEYENMNSSFVVPSNAHYLRFTPPVAYGTTYLKDITLSLYYPGESGYDQYCPFSALAEVDTGSEVLRSAGAVADEKTPDGTITRRVGTVDLGTLAWSKATVGGQTFFYAELSDGSTADDFAGICPKYPIITGGTWTNDDKVARLYGSTQYSFSRVGIKDSAYSSGDAAAFKTAMSGVYLYYELATPTTEQGTAFTGLQKVDGHGIEMVTGGTTGIPVPFTAQYLKTINAAPTDTIVITENGSHDVAMYDGAIVNVSGGGSLNLQSKNLALNAAAPPEYIRPDNTYNGLSYVRVHTEDINPAWIRSGARVCGVQGTYKGATFNHSVGINIGVVDGTFQLSLSISYRAPDSASVVWDTIIPDEHEIDGYYNYTADLDLCTGNAMDGFYLTESSGFNLDQYSIDHLTYLEVYHSGNTRTWYFFVPSNASTYSITFTP